MDPNECRILGPRLFNDAITVSSDASRKVQCFRVDPRRRKVQPVSLCVTPKGYSDPVSGTRIIKSTVSPDVMFGTREADNASAHAIPVPGSHYHLSCMYRKDFIGINGEGFRLEGSPLVFVDVCYLIMTENLVRCPKAEDVIVCQHDMECSQVPAIEWMNAKEVGAARGVVTPPVPASEKRALCAACSKVIARHPPMGSEISTKVKCGYCRGTYYCGRECQRKHWYATHTHTCCRPSQPFVAAATPASPETTNVSIG